MFFQNIVMTTMQSRKDSSTMVHQAGACRRPDPRRHGEYPVEIHSCYVHKDSEESVQSFPSHYSCPDDPAPQSRTEGWAVCWMLPEPECKHFSKIKIQQVTKYKSFSNIKTQHISTMYRNTSSHLGKNQSFPEWKSISKVGIQRH